MTTESELRGHLSLSQLFSPAGSMHTEAYSSGADSCQQLGVVPASGLAMFKSALPLKTT